ncbi:homeodomain-interacting protein kinase 2-like [Xyrichtys novacula]|uniref:Homeodomain-interacting protein kinase 2-like n=1 Tax=Xyrichtys novacula TaxID=13765 RepID=A0AAV1EL99_XYRNO|nr:homeodomain-interacting protein kinase 2-like [Xyrichtys novacula]
MILTQRSSIDLPSCLDDLVDIIPKEGAAKHEDRRAFVDLLKGLLLLKDDKRISPREALQHLFMTMSQFYLM